jgi:hypothetical protein
MDLDEAFTKKRSLGALRKAQKKKPRSPDLTGQLQLQRHTAAAIVKEFAESDADEVVCNLAGWKNDGYRGPYLTVEISPRYAPRSSEASKESNLDFVFNDQEVRN